LRGEYPVSAPEQMANRKLKQVPLKDFEEDAAAVDKILKSTPKKIPREAIQDYVQRNGAQVTAETPHGDPEDIEIQNVNEEVDDPDWDYLRTDAEELLEDNEGGLDKLIDDELDEHNEGLELEKIWVADDSKIVGAGHWELAGKETVKEHEDYIDKTDPIERTTVRERLIQEEAEARRQSAEAEGMVRRTISSEDNFGNTYEVYMDECWSCVQGWI